MSTVTLEAKSSSAIELECYPVVSQLAVGRDKRAFEADERGSVRDTERSSEYFEQVITPRTSSTVHAQVEEELAGSVDDVLPQRNVSELAPTDEGFHAWAFVGHTVLPLPNLILRIPRPSLLPRFSSKVSCGRSRPRTAPF